MLHQVVHRSRPIGSQVTEIGGFASTRSASRSHSATVNRPGISHAIIIAECPLALAIVGRTSAPVGGVGETEGMAGRVEQHSPGLARLRVSDGRPQADGDCFGLGDVIDREIQVVLL